MRIVAFVGSPVDSEEKELVKLAKKLKKEKVNVDIISFGEDSTNSDVLTTFISTLNGKVSSLTVFLILQQLFSIIFFCSPSQAGWKQQPFGDCPSRTSSI